MVGIGTGSKHAYFGVVRGLNFAERLLLPGPVASWTLLTVRE